MPYNDWEEWVDRVATNRLNMVEIIDKKGKVVLEEPLPSIDTWVRSGPNISVKFQGEVKKWGKTSAFRLVYGGHVMNPNPLANSTHLAPGDKYGLTMTFDETFIRCQIELIDHLNYLRCKILGMDEKGIYAGTHDSITDAS